MALDSSITRSGATSVIDCCWSGPGVDVEVRKEEVAKGEMWVGPAGGRRANKLDVRSRFILRNPKKNPSRPHKKVIKSGKKILKIYAFFKDLLWGLKGRGETAKQLG